MQPIIKDRVVVGMATWKYRLPTIGETLDSLIHQVSEIHVFLNGYKRIPANIPRIDNVYYHTENGNDYKSSAKFKFQNISKADYYFTCDDDLIYPTNYIEKSIKFEKNNKGCIYTYHGAVLNANYMNWKEGIILDHFRKETNQSKIVHIGGSGVMFWNLNSIKIPINIFEIDDLDDEFYLSKWTLRNNIKIVSVPKIENWIQLSKANQNVSIYNKKFIMKRNELILTEKLNLIELL